MKWSASKTMSYKSNIFVSISKKKKSCFVCDCILRDDFNNLQLFTICWDCYRRNDQISALQLILQINIQLMYIGFYSHVSQTLEQYLVTFSAFTQVVSKLSETSIQFSRVQRFSYINISFVLKLCTLYFNANLSITKTKLHLVLLFLIVLVFNNEIIFNN